MSLTWHRLLEEVASLRCPIRFRPKTRHHDQDRGAFEHLPQAYNRYSADNIF